MNYDAFVSYSHEADRSLARKLQSALQRIGKPWYVPRSLRIFRDETDLSATPHGWIDIERALDHSRYLIMLASPRAAASKWVQREIAHWLSLGRADRLLLALTEGDITWDDEKGDFDWPNTSALPRQLSKQFTQEPFWVDIRSIGLSDADSERNPAFELAVARIGAPVYGIDVETLVSRDAREHRRTIRHVSVAAAILLLLFVSASILGLYANQQRGEAIRQRNSALARQLAAEARLTQNDSSRAFALAGLMVVESLRRNGGLDATIAWQEIMSVMPRRPVHRLIHGAQATTLAYNSQGDRIAVATGDGLVTLWNARTGQKLREFVDDRWDPATKIQFSNDSRYLQCVGNSTTRTWTFDGIQPARVDDSKVEFPSVDGAARSTMTVVLDHAKGFVRLKQGAAGPERCRYPYDDGMLNVATLSPDGRQIAIGGEGRTVLVWQTACGAEGAVLSERRYVDARYLPGGRMITTRAADGQVSTWAVDGRLASTVPAPGSDKHEPVARNGRVAFNDLRGTTATFEMDAKSYSIKVWRSNGKALMHTFPIEEEVLSAEFNPNGTLLATGTNDRYLTIWSIETGSIVFKKRLANPPDTLRFSNSGKALFVGEDNDDIIVLNEHTGTTATFEMGANGHSIKIWRSNGKAPMHTFPIEEVVQFAEFNPNGTLLAAGTDDRYLTIWSIETGSIVFKKRLANPPDTLRFSDSGEALLVVGRHSADIMVLNGHTGAMTMRVSNSSEVDDIALSDDGHVLAALGNDGSANLWNLESGKQIMRLGGDLRIERLAVSPNSESFLTMSQDGVVRVWPLSSRALARSACGRLTRSMTPEEWRRYFPDEAQRETCSDDIMEGVRN
ncbi:MAG TPA: toll/interleukin-1 receptor domain-containing protein [Thermoanaerobaculia bacterium]|jgi:WD40 repeat protein|nr:toll/interleukin-1 receptor domain-containing protein [Thermoanaerobaculia bacterium]